MTITTSTTATSTTATSTTTSTTTTTASNTILHEQHPSKKDLYRLPSPFHSILYLPDFISSAEATDLLSHIFRAPKQRWTTLRNRRLQTWGTVSLSQSGQSIIQSIQPVRSVVQPVQASPLPSWMKPILARIHALEVFPAHLPPNHCLVNEYRPGQGIMPHLDGPCYASVVATVSLGEATLLDFYRYNPQQPDLPVLSKADPQSSSQSVQPKAFSVVVEPLSLLVLEEEAYESYMHGIDESFGFWVDTDPHDGSTILNASSVMARLSAADSNRDSSLSVSTLHSIEANESSVEHSAANMSNAAIYIHRVGTRISLTFRHTYLAGKSSPAAAYTDSLQRDSPN
ncbi:hypothetical protein BASA61_009269 [Batrachochytrium salamandrivorans]|nr:hypothetical protein BASA61_009269 [Batrachochytrium salamandrivorans]